MSKITLDWNEYSAVARQVAAEGAVLIKNDNNVLPFNKGDKISVFGRIMNHYYKSGTGSGGMVNVHRVVGILDGLRESNYVTLNEDLIKVYEAWEEDHPFEQGAGWGQEPWCQEEMEVSDELAKEAAGKTDAALVIIGRTAGEDKDCSDTEGSYRLQETETRLLTTVRKNFKKMTVLLNVGAIMDMSFIDEIKPDAVIYTWHGGEIGGYAASDVLCGKVNPCGKLPDTIAYNVSDYPSNNDFGKREFNCYTEDIYVGYRYFETFAKDKVRYPFGYGLSYTTFETALESAVVDGLTCKVSVKVTNTGKVAGKEVIALYAGATGVKLNRPAIELIDYAKTGVLNPGESEVLTFDYDINKFETYDDRGITGYKSAYVVEQGIYNISFGTTVRDVTKACEIQVPETILVLQSEEAYAPIHAFNRMCANGTEAVPLETVDMEKRRIERLPDEIPSTGDVGIKLKDVYNGHNSLEEFVAQISDEDLVCITRGEGMGSPKVTPGTAAAFGGVTDGLKALGIPAVCCDDGPSGMRLDTGAKAFSIPIGTLIAATFNRELVTRLFGFLAIEMVSNHVECLLAPGMNIHRHPLNGRNFEYFSEDPYLTGSMAVAELKGLNTQGVTGTIKHFCGNNQETNRYGVDSVISERALRDIYLRGFKMAIKEGEALTVMTTYGSVNGLWTAGAYDLNTTILRGEWGFEGMVMTDWWAAINERGQAEDHTNFAQMVRSQNDVYMVCPESDKNKHGDNLQESLDNGTLTKAELQRSAMNILKVVLKSQALKRLMGTNDEVEILNKPAVEGDINANDIAFTELLECQVLSLEGKKTVSGTSFLYAYEVTNPGEYLFSLKASSKLGRLAQIPVAIFLNSVTEAVITCNGTEGEDAIFEKVVNIRDKNTLLKVYVGGNGLDLKELTIKKA